MENSSSIFLIFPKKKINLIFDFLLKCSKKYGKTLEFCQKFETALNINYTSRNKILQQLMDENFKK